MERVKQKLTKIETTVKPAENRPPALVICAPDGEVIFSGGEVKPDKTGQNRTDRSENAE